MLEDSFKSGKNKGLASSCSLKKLDGEIKLGLRN
jgi:hypothetical protein